MEYKLILDAIVYSFRALFNHIFLFIKTYLVIVLTGNFFLLWMAFFYLIIPHFRILPFFTGTAIFIIAAAISTWINLGVQRVAFDIVDTDSSVVNRIFSTNTYLVRSFFANVLFFSIVFLGLICLIIPGIYFAVREQFYNYSLVDRNCTIRQAFNYSFSLSKNNFFFLLLWGICSSIFLAIPILNILSPFTWSMGNVFLYRTLEKQKMNN